MPRDLGYADVHDLLTRLGPIAKEIVLVGGQAVNYWVEQYADRVPELAAAAPYTSKDIDFCATPEQVQACARALNGSCKIASFDDAPPSTGLVIYKGAEENERQIDFLQDPSGLSGADVFELSIPIGKDAQLRVMHPIHALISRTYNVAKLQGYNTDHGRKQLIASVFCAREFLSDLLQQGHSRAATKLSEEIIQLSYWDKRGGLTVFLRHGIDVFEPDPRLLPKFCSERYPNVGDLLGVTRKRIR